MRARGPAFWADFGDARTIIGSLAAIPAHDVGSWRARVRAQAPAGGAWREGLVGWFGYEAGEAFERMPPPRTARLMPDAWWGQITAVVHLDRAGRAVYSRGLEPGELSGAALREPAPPGGATVEEPADEVYLHGVRRVLEHLRAGDCYQVNLSRRLVCRGAFHPLATWLRLRRDNPSRRGLFLETDDGAVVSNSPELLLRARRRSAVHVLSVPIKGTAALGSDPRALLQSDKERAELTMIVDLVRADLGRVAAPGTVWAGARRVGRVGHVWHAMQRVGAELAPGLDAVDAFAALFPAGSVTGAPRVRAMEVIHALEPVARGVYCGSLGWFGADGADANVAIRTISFRGDEAHVQTGSGLVLASDPARELAEARLKAERLLAAL